MPEHMRSYAVVGRGITGMISFRPVPGYPIRIELGPGVYRERHCCKWKMVEIMEDQSIVHKCCLQFSNGQHCTHYYFQRPGWPLPTEHIAELEMIDSP